jgi:hypothetical protein
MWQHKKNLEFCATRSRRAVSRQLAGELVYVVVFFFISSFLCIFHMLKKELDEKLMDWKMSLETLKNSRNVVSLSIYHPIKQSSILQLSFYWKCLLHPY